jgi:hypothetical protein
MFQMVMQITDDQFMKMAEARMETVPDFIIQAIRK